MNLAEIKMFLITNNFDTIDGYFYFKSDHHGGRKSIEVKKGNLGFEFTCQWLDDEDGWEESPIFYNLREALNWFE
jgi:hypothetical protein